MKNSNAARTRDTCLVGSKVWVQVQDETRMFEFGEVIHISQDSEYTVETENGEQFVVGVEDIKLTHENGGKPVGDLLNLNDYSEESLLHSLRERYGQDEFYSMVGPILISINPYKWCDIYGQDFVQEFRGKRRAQGKPHVFSVAENAYRAVVEDSERSSQAIIISGESGAGKTEATKIIMKYLSTAGRQQRHEQSSEPRSPTSPQEPSQRGLEHRVLDSNPLLEAFGNAKTIRNDNSSRFGKFIQIQIDNTGLIVGAKVINYLLEKSRIIRQAEGERNYHIFYQLLRGADKSLLESIGISGIMEHDFAYIRTGSFLPMHEEDDIASFQRTQYCLESIGVSPAEQLNLFKTLAGVLLLGNVEFDDRSEHEGCTARSDFVSKAAQVLGLPEDQLGEALCAHIVQVGGEVIRKPISAGVAEDKRDALSKALYALLFRWLVLRINASLGGAAAASASMMQKAIRAGAPQSSEDGQFIGILDIYGFEVFEDNSFEQFCINFANEKLQRHFNKYIFEVEQTEYEKEGIDWSRIEFNDNQPCLDLIDHSQTSVLCLLDEECIMPKGSDSSFLRKLHNNHKDRHQHYVTRRLGGDSIFGIKHYAGVVEYNVEGFISKNNDALSEELCSLMQRSSNTWIKTLFPQAQNGSSKSRKRGSSLRAPTVSQQFRKQLESLTQKLESCKPHFIRCIKPNDFKIPGCFDTLKCLNQLRYAGMMETVRIRDAGYALREKHESFYRRFKILAPDAKSCTELVQQIARQFDLQDSALWQIGHTKVFLKRSLSELLDRCASVRLTAASRTIAKAFKETILRKKKEAIMIIEGFYERVKFVLLLRRILKMQCVIRIRLARIRTNKLREQRKQMAPHELPDTSNYVVPDFAKLEAERKAATKSSSKPALKALETRSKRSKPTSRQDKAKPEDVPQKIEAMTSIDLAELSRLRAQLEQAKLAEAQATARALALEQKLSESGERQVELETHLESLKARVEEGLRREAVATSRIVDCESFLESFYNGEESSSLNEDQSRTLEQAVSSLLQTVKKSLKQMEKKVREESDMMSYTSERERRSSIHSDFSSTSSDELKALLLQQSEMMRKTFEAERNARSEEGSRTQILEQTIETQRREIEKLKMDLAQSNSLVERLRAELEHEQSDNQVRISSLEKELEHGLAERQRLEISLEESLEVQRRLEMENKQATSSVDLSVSNLMRENVALLDEVLDTRSKHQGLLRKAQKLESRARQAEAANETLVTLLSWRDNQLALLLDDKQNLKDFKASDLDSLETQLGNLRPYLEKIASTTESKLDEYDQ